MIKLLQVVKKLIKNKKWEVFYMATIFDVAEWFLSKEPMTHKKVQKLCYYAQAWSYAICPKPLTNSEFEAWVHGPVCNELYQKYKAYEFNNIPQCKRPTCFTEEENDFLESVWETYGNITAIGLEGLSHSEPPWQEARLGLQSNESSHNIITHESMKEYYRSVYIGGDA